MQETADQNNSKYRRFLRSDSYAVGYYVHMKACSHLLVIIIIIIASTYYHHY